MRTRLSAEAAAFLRSEAAYLRSRSASAARSFQIAFQAARRNLERFPELGAARGRLPIRGVRTLVVGDYLLHYRISEHDGYLEIVAIRHHRQAPLMPYGDEDDDGHDISPIRDR